jgi:hypothetical protein
MIADCNEAIKDKADVFHSSFEDFQKSVCENASPNLPVVKGEMRHHYTTGSTSVLFGWVISARMDIKKDNFITEQVLTNYAEPLAAFAGFLGASYPQGFIDVAYNWLLQNHGHDSIGGCSRDIIGNDMVYRYRQCREISSCVIERAMLDIAGSINLSKCKVDDMALVVYNPASFIRSEVLPAVIDIPQEWKCDGFEIVDEENERVRTQICEKIGPSYPIVQSPNDTANMFPMTRYNVQAQFENIPSMGYRTFFVKPLKKFRLSRSKQMQTGPRTM